MDDCIANDCLPHAPEAVLVADPEYDIDRDQMQESVYVAMCLLTDREYRVLFERLWNKKTLKDIGLELGVTGDRVRQIQCRAIRKLRHPMRLRCITPVYYEGFY